MKDELKSILKGTSGTEERGDGRDLPLAHGIIHAVRLAVEHRRTLRRHLGTGSNTVNTGLLERMIEVFCQGIQVSLAVVADVRDGEMIKGMDD